MPIILVRHADSIVPETGGPDDYHRPLSAQGRVQARELAAGLAERRPAAVVSSPYLRAVQTVQPLAAMLGVPIAADYGLREWDSGIEPTPGYARLYSAAWAAPDTAQPVGESLNDLSERAGTVLAAIAAANPGVTVVVASHGTFIARALGAHGWRVDWEFSKSMPMPAVYELPGSETGGG